MRLSSPREAAETETWDLKILPARAPCNEAYSYGTNGSNYRVLPRIHNTFSKLYAGSTSRVLQIEIFL
jgi:hypothetical protein